MPSEVDWEAVINLLKEMQAHYNCQSFAIFPTRGSRRRPAECPATEYSVVPCVLMVTSRQL